MKLQREFTISFIFSFVGLILAAGVGYYYGSTTGAALAAVFTVFVLGVLEVSISFDNAVVNATVLKNMTPLWQHRFLTWGILIAVFGMRLIFPLAIVAILGEINPWAALKLAALEPEKYAEMMRSVHHEVSAFGGAFLLLVALKYFIDSEKSLHWIRLVEVPLSKMGRLEAVESGIGILIIMIFSRYIPDEEKLPFIYAGIAGVLTFLFVEGVNAFLMVPDSKGMDIHKASAGMFIYLEVLDASFSFDGVIGAFAITNNLFLIAIGLGIGAFFVRSLTLWLLEKGTLETFKYLEHGAFYAVAALAVIMFLNTVFHIPEIITGMVGAAFIGLSVWASIREKRAAQ